MQNTSLSEHLGSKWRLEERTKAGIRALSAWWKRSRTSVGEVRGETFVRMLDTFVELVLRCTEQIEVWGGGKQLGLVKKVQGRSSKNLFGSGQAIPKHGTAVKMRIVPLKWEAKRRCVEYWVNVLRMSDSRLVKLVIPEALELRGRME